MGIYKDNETQKTYSGAGVLIIEDYYTKSGEIIECIVLVRNKSSTLYMDFGGAYEKKHVVLQNTVHQELREESRNLFIISPNNFKHYVDIPAGEHYYRVYIIKINGICRKYYMHNLKLFEKVLHSGQKVPKQWRETDNIAHIPIKNINFDDMGKRGIIKIKDVDDNTVTLHRRSKKVISYTQDILNNTSIIPLLASRKDISICQSDDFTNGSYCYHIN